MNQVECDSENEHADGDETLTAEKIPKRPYRIATVWTCGKGCHQNSSFIGCLPGLRRKPRQMDRLWGEYLAAHLVVPHTIPVTAATRKVLSIRASYTRAKVRLRKVVLLVPLIISPLQKGRQTKQRLKRLGKAYAAGLYSDEDYRREKRTPEDKPATLVVPGVDAAMEAGKLLEHLPDLREKANLAKRRELLMATLDAVYVDTVEEKSVVAIRLKPSSGQS